VRLGQGGRVLALREPGMSGITVIVVPTWAVWIFTALAVVNIVQHIWKIVLLKKQARREPPNVF
jgi:hypothetical protein